MKSTSFNQINSKFFIYSKKHDGLFRRGENTDSPRSFLPMENIVDYRDEFEKTCKSFYSEEEAEDEINYLTSLRAVFHDDLVIVKCEIETITKFSKVD